MLSTQKQPSCKKGVALCKMTGVEKVVKCDGRSETKILTTTIQVNFVLIPAQIHLNCCY